MDELFNQESLALYERDDQFHKSKLSNVLYILMIKPPYDDYISLDVLNRISEIHNLRWTVNSTFKKGFFFCKSDVEQDFFLQKLKVILRCNFNIPIEYCRVIMPI